MIGVSDKLVSSPSHFQLIKKRIDIKNYFCDVRNIKKFRKLIKKTTLYLSSSCSVSVKM